MFKNKKFEVKVLDDKQNPIPNGAVYVDRKPRISKEDLTLIKDTVKIIGAVWVTTCVIDAIARIGVANQENRQKED